MSSPIIWLAVIIIVFVSSSCTSGVQHNEVSSDRENSPLKEPEALKTHDQQTREVMPQNLISAEVEPLPNQTNQAALALQRLGFRILHIGPSISVQAPRSLWESTFNVSFEQQKKTVMPEIGREVTYLRAITDRLVIPEGLKSLISAVMFAEPPEFYQEKP
ncbi:hypothetical protein [Lyngbya confervoides]|uniref:Uncharacterized protein n=1 Tax=Lyngbya confervoides BDU141951 TaxID=1574623 RepID=A0ABD4T2I7_9CYAN|nr:hypothetical protein [Lyngbya confervoides]MCM1982452.1 hypothetical protein [Lyngbya confervoides BDU141951]